MNKRTFQTVAITVGVIAAMYRIEGTRKLLTGEDSGGWWPF
tara:strand:- start:3622 stop:3744 length:123 start_codon:yes stop_codon:yes gene_type:complete